MKIVAVNVAELRRQRGWTQETLAERADLSLTAIAHLETERRWPELTTIEKIAAALSVPASRLFVDPTYIPKPTVREALNVLAAAHGLEVRAPKRRRK